LLQTACSAVGRKHR